jgi:hypothetical protein
MNRLALFLSLVVILAVATLVSFGTKSPSREPATVSKSVPQKITPTQNIRAISSTKNVASEVNTEKLYSLEACYDSETCEFPKRDPREYDLAISRAIAKELEVLGSQIHDSQERVRIGAKFLTHTDGYVKSASLKLLSSGPPSPDALRAILDGVIGAHDESLVEPALNELQKYKEPEEREDIAEAIANALKQGSVGVAVALATKLGKILNSEQKSLYQEAANSLPVDSRIRSLILAALHASEQ